MPQKNHHPRAPSGFALVLALAALAVMMILLLALFHGASHQLRGAESDANYAREKMLADSAVALVVGQIQQASTMTGQTWISQPGLLRTYGTTLPRQPTASYKLYSTSTLSDMIDTTGTLAFLNTDIPTDWNSTKKKNLYTDLNTPVETTSGQLVYPILDPAAAGTIPGVSIDPGYDVEMPAAWLYQLRDGTLGPASNGTAANPIVARIAFWTDDDTCKVNINTAGVGSPWNTPHANSTDDVSSSTRQPAAGEYSSYPGHPAMTSLSVIFGSGTNPLSPAQLLGLTPRYVYGGSQLGSQTTTPGQVVPPKTDRLYSSLDELCFSSTMTDGVRQSNPVNPSQLNIARFVLTAHSQAPETTLLGEPRISIWPVSNAPQDTTHTTATDRAMESVATVGTRNYFFQRGDPLDPGTDFKSGSNNLQLFQDLIARGNVALPGYGSTFTQKYSGAAWTQIALEITDFIHGLNAVDPSPAPFIPFAAGDSTGVGRGFVPPLTTTYTDATGNTTAVRGLSRSPTLSSLTLVFYVCGFQFKDGTQIDYTATPDTDGSSWKANFDPASTSNRWSDVTAELVRAFVVPCTFQPGCAYPEVSDACDIQISGLDKISINNLTTNAFGFTLSPAPHSRLLSDALTVLPQERMWGGNEGPLAWRAAALDPTPTESSYPFVGTKALAIPLSFDAATKTFSWPSPSQFTFNGVTGLTVLIRDRNGATLQTLNVDLPPFTIQAPPNIDGECNHKDGSTPGTSDPNWATSPNTVVAPSYYMNLQNRILATQRSRALMIQAGDVTRSVEAGTDLRVIAGLSTVPSSLFRAEYPMSVYNSQAIFQRHNFRFADGTSACFAPYPAANSANDYTHLVASASYPQTASTLITVANWRDGSSVAYPQYISPSCSVPTYTKWVAMTPGPGIPGDWDTGPGLEPDGAQINLPDAGTALDPTTAYFSLSGGQVGAATQRTPNALVPSPVIFGSLPAGIDPVSPASSEPWRTLLFCPYPAGNNSSTPYSGHPGSLSPPDYLILDNFWMPVIEPYAISTCMATGGKINLNDQIAPFTWLHRNTAFHALLNDLRIPAISFSSANAYKSPGTPLNTIWNPVDENATIAQIENRFANGSTDAYLSESEICSVPLVPSLKPPQTPLDTSSVAAVQTALKNFWNGSAGQLTGDNLRELPYAQLYSRLTTRSNSYTVHVRVQVLQKLTGDPHQDIWNENTDLVLGDWRGSYEIERYLDPSATAPAAGQPLGPYKFRIVSSRRFTP